MRRLACPVVALLCLVPLGAGGCHSTRNVTGRVTDRGDYRRDAVYVLEQEAFLFKRPAMNLLDELRLDVPRYQVRRTIRHGSADGAKLVAPLPAGTTFRFKRLVEHIEPIVWREVLVVARILDGPHKGKEVDARFINDPDLLTAAPADRQ